jgi:DNA recombination protein RmuC
MTMLLGILAVTSIGGACGLVAAAVRHSRLTVNLEERVREVHQLRETLENRETTNAANARLAADKLGAAEKALAQLATSTAARTATLEAQLADRETQLDEYKALREEAALAKEERERLLATLEGERLAAANNLALLDHMDVRLKDAFFALSSQALQANNQAFVNLATASMGEFQQSARADLDARQRTIAELVTPVRDGLARVDEKLREFDRDRAAGQSALHQQLSSLAETQQRLTDETQLLVRSLRSPQARGQWGELQLRRVVELAGMLEHCDFVEQATIHADSGRLRPDMIVRLPGDKVVVVDSKAPLAAYLDAVESIDETERLAHLDRHAKQVRDHISALVSKDYSRQFTEAPDFLVMFLPGEAFFSAACQRDPSLIEFAVSQGVIPASPTTLITVLKAVFYGWQQERIARNAEDIRDLGIDLYSRMRTVADHLAKVRKGLEAAVTAYNSAVGSLESRVLPVARKLNDLGAGGGDEIQLLEPVGTLARLSAAPELTLDSPDDREHPILVAV